VIVLFIFLTLYRRTRHSNLPSDMQCWSWKKAKCDITDVVDVRRWL